MKRYKVGQLVVIVDLGVVGKIKSVRRNSTGTFTIWTETKKYGEVPLTTNDGSYDFVYKTVDGKSRETTVLKAVGFVNLIGFLLCFGFLLYMVG